MIHIYIQHILIKFHITSKSNYNNMPVLVFMISNYCFSPNIEVGNLVSRHMIELIKNWSWAWVGLKYYTTFRRQTTSNFTTATTQLHQRFNSLALRRTMSESDQKFNLLSVFLFCWNDMLHKTIGLWLSILGAWIIASRPLIFRSRLQLCTRALLSIWGIQTKRAGI